MRIGVVADPPLVTHSCAVVAGQLSKNWVKQGHEVFYLGYNYEGAKVSHKDGYDVFPDTIPPTRKESVSRFIRDTKVDIIYGHGNKDIFAEGIKAAKENNISYFVHTFLQTQKIAMPEMMQIGSLLKDTDNVTEFGTCNSFSAALGNAMNKLVWVVPNGVDTSIFTLEGNNYRKELNIPTDAFVCLFSGSNIIGKGSVTALKAFNNFFKQTSNKNCYLVMHTRPETPYADLKKLVQELELTENVKFLTDAFPEWLKEPDNYKLGACSPPYTSTPYELMGNVFRTGNVLLAPTLMEGMSTTILEGMGCGLPVICSDDPIISEPIVPYSTGLLVHRNLGNECLLPEITEALFKLSTDTSLLREMSLNAANLVKVKYNWEYIAKHLIYLFQNLLNKRYG